MFDRLRADVRRNLKDYEPCSTLRRIGLLVLLNSVHAVTLIRAQQWCAEHHLPTFIPAKLLFWFLK